MSVAIGAAVAPRELGLIRMARETWWQGTDKRLTIMLLRYGFGELGVGCNQSQEAAASLRIVWECDDRPATSLSNNVWRMQPLWERLLAFDHDFCIKVDADTLLYPDNLYGHLKALQRSPFVYAGSEIVRHFGGDGTGLRRWLETAQPPLPIAEWQHAAAVVRTRQKAPDPRKPWAFAQGGFELLSRDATRLLVQSRCLLAMGGTDLRNAGNNRTSNLPRYEDSALGLCMWTMDVPLTHLPGYFVKPSHIQLARQHVQNRCGHANTTMSYRERTARALCLSVPKVLFNCSNVLAVHALKRPQELRMWWSECNRDGLNKSGSHGL